VPTTPVAGVDYRWLLAGLIVVFTIAVGAVVYVGGHRSARRKY
jgi:hypothetical protein